MLVVEQSSAEFATFGGRPPPSLPDPSPSPREVAPAAAAVPRSARRRRRPAAAATGRDRQRPSSSATPTVDAGGGGGVLKEEPVQFPVTFHTPAAYFLTTIKLYATFSIYFRVLFTHHLWITNIRKNKCRSVRTDN